MVTALPLGMPERKKEDLIKTDHAAMECIPKDRRGQDMDNWIWIRDAEKNNQVVGTRTEFCIKTHWTYEYRTAFQSKWYAGAR